MKKRALLIGINEYHFLGELKYSRQDAEDIGRALQTHCGFQQDEITLMSCAGHKSQMAMANYIEHAISSLRNYRDLEMLVFGFWGHGFSSSPGKRYICGLDTDENDLERTAVSFDLICSQLAQVQAVNTLLLLDCCQNAPAGKSVGAKAMTEGEEVALASMARDIQASRRKQPDQHTVPTVAILNACREGQKAYEWDNRRHGIFTAHLLDAFDQGFTSIAPIAKWATDRVNHTANSLFHHKQTPYITIKGGGDIILSSPGVKHAKQPPKPKNESTQASYAPSAASPAKTIASKNKNSFGLNRLAISLLLMFFACSAIYLASQYWSPEWVRERDLAKAEEAAISGNTVFLNAITKKYPSDEVFSVYRQEGQKVWEEQKAFEKIESLAKTGDVENVQSQVADYPENVRFQQLVDLAKAQKQIRTEEAYQRIKNLAESGNVENVQLQVANYAEPRFQKLVELAESRKRQIETDRRKKAKCAAQSAAGKGDIQGVTVASNGYVSEPEFVQLLKDAQTTKKRMDDLSKAEELSAEGNVEEVKKIVQQYPNDTVFTDFIVKAEKVGAREHKLKEAHEAAKQGDVEKVKAIVSEYPNDKNFLGITKLAQEQATYIPTLSKIKSTNDLVLATSLSHQYKEDTAFNEAINSIRHDGDYAYILGGEIDAKGSQLKGKKVKLTGTVMGMNLNAGVIWSIELLTKDQNYKISATFSKPPPSSSSANTLRGKEVTIWGILQSGWTTYYMTDVDLVAIDVRSNRSDIEKIYAEAKETIASKDFDRARVLQQSFCSRKWDSLKTQTAKKENEFKIRNESQKRDETFDVLQRDVCSILQEHRVRELVFAPLNDYPKRGFIQRGYTAEGANTKRKNMMQDFQRIMVRSSISCRLSESESKINNNSAILMFAISIGDTMKRHDRSGRNVTYKFQIHSESNEVIWANNWTGFYWD